MSLKKLFLCFLKLPVFQFFWEKTHRLSLIGMNYWGGNDIYSSGEINVIKYIYKSLNNTNKGTLHIFDVGANIGKYCQLLVDLFQVNTSAHIHCFEPSKKTFEKLSSISFSKKNVFITNNNFGFSDITESKELFSSSHTATIASLYTSKSKNEVFKEDYKEVIELKTIDDYCEKKGIKTIDFLKLDIEGHELLALKGAQKMIDRKSISYIQFEFGDCNISSKTYMRDFFDILQGYSIYRILPNGLRLIKNYGEDIEIFATSNFLAILK